MGNRLSKIYTRTGDNGSTGLTGGGRISKSHIRIDAIGDIDELNAHIGLLISMTKQFASELRVDDQITQNLFIIQHDLFDLGGELSMPGFAVLDSTKTQWLEQWLDQENQHLEALKEFVLPGGNLLASQCHVCRTVCRRAERKLVALHECESVNLDSLTYINRLSDLLFVLCRVLVKLNGGQDVYWEKNISRESRSDEQT